MSEGTHGGGRDSARARSDDDPARPGGEPARPGDEPTTADSGRRHSIDPETGIHLSLRVPDRPTLHHALRSLVEADVSFEINRISDAGAHSSLAIVDMEEFTEKQREAIELAFEHGYYATPREAGLQEISDELGVSKSAVSQRLRAIESKLIRAVLEGQTATGSD